ncbi:hypothetical protein SAMN05421770_102484 [Granulicella rosea]|uniref:Uncharacterized protein n=1 Tax=Granulicella rosea TaxID=474952 RepID=A0A239HPE5_9BACT|nr:hypothetical protein [Granulicella rosea]SNS82958.1 hypothetical protein SAMN05421770_102484 [Granulicella rosea]
MTKQMKAALTAVLIAGTLSAQAQTTTTPTAKKKAKTSKTAKKAKAPAESALTRELREMREKQAAQQAQIDSLSQQVAAKDAALATAQSSAAKAESDAQTANAQVQGVSSSVQANTDAVNSVKSDVSDLKTANVGLATTISATKTELTEKIDSPLALHYKGITITPVAFFAFEGVWRERSVNSDINTPFNSIPFPGATEGHVSELNFSGRQSRLGGLFEGNAGTFKLSGYFEADFLGTGTSSNNNQSDSYVLRQRQIWGQAATQGGFTVTGGQMWSLVTEDGKGADNRTEKLPNTVDPQYMVGFSWTRQPALRLQQKFGDYKTGAFTIAASVEQAQITNFTVSSTVSAAIPVQYFFGGPGQNGGLYNAAGNIGNGNTASTSGITNYANNVAPDLVFKAAYDNKYSHFELGGLARFLRDYYYSVTSLTGTAALPVYAYGSVEQHNTKSAGGVFGSARASASKYLDVAIQGMAGTGVGRYGSAQLADATLRPDETIEPIKNYHGMFSLESHPTKKLDVYSYYGGEYAKRTIYAVNPTGGGTDLIGYGAPNLSDTGCYTPATNVVSGGSAGSDGSLSTVGSCASPTKYIQEGMIGFTYRVVNSPKFGRLQYQATYSLIQRQLWSGVGSATTPVSPRAQDSMIHFGMRYYIP